MTGVTCGENVLNVSEVYTANRFVLHCQCSMSILDTFMPFLPSVFLFYLFLKRQCLLKKYRILNEVQPEREDTTKSADPACLVFIPLAAECWQAKLILQEKACFFIIIYICITSLLHLLYCFTLTLLLCVYKYEFKKQNGNSF